MKIFLTFFSLCVISFLSIPNKLSAQNVSQILTNLKDEMGEITIDKITYKQSIEVLDETKGKIRYQSVAVNEKGESATSAFEFYLSDIDKNTLVRKPSGKKFFVSFYINNKQKFIKCYKNEKLEIYAENLDIMVADANVAQNVIKSLNEIIPFIKTSEKSWSNSAEAYSWLKSNITEVKGKTGSILQTFSNNNNLLELNVKVTDSKGTSTDEKYNWDVTDLNKEMLNLKVSGAELSVVLSVKNNEKYIQYTKNNQLQNYISSFDIMAKDVDQAKTIISAFTFIATNSKIKLPEFSTQQAALDFLVSKIGNITSDQKTIQQKITFANGNSVKCTYSSEEPDSKGKNINSTCEFYLPDAEPLVSFNVTGKRVVIPVSMTSGHKYVRFTKDNVLQNYTEDFEIYQNDIQSAREVVTAFRAALKKLSETPHKFGNISEALKFIQSNIESTTIGSDQYKIQFEGKLSEPYATSYTYGKTDAKAVTTEESFLVYPYMLDSSSIKVNTEGKYLVVNALTVGKKSLIKKIKKDVNSFTNELSITCFDVKKAKDIAAALKYITTNAKPVSKTFDNKQAALDYIKQNTGEITVNGKTIKQKLEVDNTNPCKVSLSRLSTDDKDKTTEEIYEFTFLDINKSSVDYKVSGTGLSLSSGSNLAVDLTCKNNQKLIKPYKNSAQQSYISSIDILVTDADIAKNIADAIKYLIGVCE
jgi:hypothetical protein